MGQQNYVGKAEIQDHAFPLVTGTHPDRQEGDVQQCDHPTLELGKETKRVVVVESPHAPLITLLWKLGHECEALAVFDIVRERARVDAEYAVAVQGSGLRWKPQMGIPGFFLNLPRDVCHGVMRAKLEQKDWQAVIEAMRASSRGPRRGTLPKATTGSLEAEKTAAVGSARCGGTIGSTSTTSPNDERDGWAPDEETYAIALETCGKVSTPWFSSDMRKHPTHYIISDPRGFCFRHPRPRFRMNEPRGTAETIFIQFHGVPDKRLIFLDDNVTGDGPHIRHARESPRARPAHESLCPNFRVHVMPDECACLEIGDEVSVDSLEDIDRVRRI